MTLPRREIIGDCTLWLGDCLDVLPFIADETVDMIWTDPPYGHSNHDGDLNARLNTYRGLDQQPIANDSPDSMRTVVDAMLTHAARILKRDCCCCCCCGGGPRPTFAWLAERMDSSGLSFFHSVIWDKKNPGLGWMYRRRHEMVMISHRHGGKMLWDKPKVAVPNIVEFIPPRDRSHPNEKPEAMVRAFIEWHSSAGHLVVDPFMGSGTTGVACASLRRNFIGIEIDESYFDVACRRIEKAYEQPALCFSVPAVQQQDVLL